MSHTKQTNEQSDADTTWTRDDPEVLRAALQFIDSCDFSDTNDGSGNETTTVPDATPARVKQPSHRRIRDELKRLRELVTRLETQIENARPRVPPSGAANSTCEQDYWHGAARCQRDLRTTAEVENAKLRQLILTQLSIARRLVKTAKRGTSTELRDASTDT